MNFLDLVFQVFSRRPRPPVEEPLEIPETLRNRIFLFCNDLYSNKRAEFSMGDYVGAFWHEAQGMLCLRHGRLWLTRHGEDRQSSVEDAIQFTLHCGGDHYLDFVEYIFRAKAFFRVALPEHQVISELNQLLQFSNAPFFVTGFVKEQVDESDPRGGTAHYVYTREYPRAVLRTAEVLHVQSTLPLLEFLRRPEYKAANSEYLSAMEDFRHGAYGDTLTKCGSCFESVLKIICRRRGWRFNENDTAAPLIKTVLANTTLPSFFEQVLIIVATLRNKLSTAHGAGDVSRAVHRHVAEFALNATAACILLLVKEVGDA